MASTRERVQTQNPQLEELRRLAGDNGVLEIESPDWTAGLYTPGTFDPTGSFLGRWPKNALLFALSDEPGVEMGSPDFEYDELFSITEEGIEVLLDLNHLPVVESKIAGQVRPKNGELRNEFVVYSIARFGDENYDEVLGKILEIVREPKEK